MAEPFLADIRIFGFNFAPRGWAQCDGQLLPINQNQSLYSLLGTTYGGDGQTTFGLPDLRGRVPIHRGNSNTAGGTDHQLGQKGGEPTVTLTNATIPAHQHALQANPAAATTNTPTAGANLLGNANIDLYRTPDNMTGLNPATISSSGNDAHQNQQPYQVVNICIALQGVFPSRN